MLTRLCALEYSSHSKATIGLFVPLSRALAWLQDSGVTLSPSPIEEAAKQEGEELRRRRSRAILG
jgi:rRNA processing protein Krr1/Pno1